MLKELRKNALILLLSLALILFTQWIKNVKNPGSAPLTWDTLGGLFLLGLFALIGILVKHLLSGVKIKFIRDFPVLGWVSMTSLIMCMIFPTAIKWINGVNFLAITTPILTFAGISVADRLTDISKMSWKIVIVGIFVFLGTYLGSGILAQAALYLSGK